MAVLQTPNPGSRDMRGLVKNKIAPTAYTELAIKQSY